MVEALTKEERDDFIHEASRLGIQMTRIILQRHEVERFSALPRADRITVLAEMRRTRGLKR